jgi:hypothetical protein
MDVLPRPDVILTHESDLDGFVSGHLLQRLARHLFHEDIRLEAWNTQAWRQRPLKERSAWVCDLAMDARLDRPEWLVIDHHPTDLQPRSARMIHDLTKSAALLSYELCQRHGIGSPPLERLVMLTDIADLFREEHPEFTLAQDYAGLAKTYPFWNLSKLIGGELERLVDHPLLEVIQTKRRVEDPLGLAWSRSRIVELSPDLAYVEIVVGNPNLIVHELLRGTECRVPVLATLMKKSASGVVVSLRSRGGEALGIAQKLQGGGHPNAAGATLPRSIQNIPDALDYLRRVLNPQPAGLLSLGGAMAGLSLDG